MTRIIAVGAWVGLVVSLAVGSQWLQRVGAVQAGGATVQAPKFEVDPMWPKPLPNHWILGSAIGVWVDQQDHVWIIHRGASTLDPNENGAGGKLTKECCSAAPPVLEYDPGGKLVQSWGGPGQGFEWPQSNHGIFVETNGTVWIAGNGAQDGQLLKFTRDGKFLKQFGFGWANAGSTDTFAFRQPAKIFVDEKNKTAYIADGYGNKRVVVMDSETGAFKKVWGAYGNVPSDEDTGRYRPTAPPPQQFRNPVHCADLSNDRLLYVCDRQGNRLQVFTPEGKFIKEQWYARRSLGEGAVWDIAFSKDPAQRYIFLADGRNQKVRIIVRETLEEITAFGDGGRQPGQFFGVHSIATDSKGNIYTTETYEGKRLQKFVYKGIGPVRRGNQGVVWPTR